MLKAYATGGKGNKRESKGNANSTINDIAKRAVSEDWGERKLVSEMNNAFSGVSRTRQRSYISRTRMAIHKLNGDV